MSAPLRGPTIWFTELSGVRRLITKHRVGQRLAGRFVAGDTLEAAMRVAGELHARGVSTMLNHLGEEVASPAQAAVATDAYVRALKRVHEQPGIDCTVSVKLTQLGLDTSTELCLGNMERVLQAASDGANGPTLVMIDMESHHYVDRALDIYLALRDRFPNVGVCLQACLHRTEADAARLGGPAAIVRMVKGAYLEPAEVALQRLRDVRRAFARLTATLFVSGSSVHVATHDPGLVEGAASFVHEHGIPSERYEFQMLYGIRRDLQAALVGKGEPVRVYVPYGTQWYPYLTRRLAERPGNIWFFLSNALRRGS
jgi:proline dehydrogenase